MIDSYLIRYFLAVVDHGNFSRAARVCAVSQPTLSVGISKLETVVGHVLFHRTNRRVELTPAGTTFAAHARRIETELAMALQAMAEDQPSKLIRVGLISTLPSEWVGNATKAARKTDGERLEIVEGRMQDLLPRLERGRIDVLIGVLGNDTRERETLFEEGYALALPMHHPHAHRRSVLPEDVADADMIVRRNCEALPDVSRFFTQRGIRPFFAARTHNDDRAVAYVKAGLGITVMPACFAQPGMAMPRLEGFEQRRRVGLLIEPDSFRRVEHSATVSRFADALRSAAMAQPRG
jgi:DNA-binding transcriptional LysR family regulator